MSETIDTKLKIESWDEKVVEEFDDKSKISTADTALSGEGQITAARSCSTLYYHANGTSDFVVILRLKITIGDRSGSVVLSGAGGYDGTTATEELSVVEGSALGDLAGLTGSARSSSTKDDYPHMPLTFEYDLA